MGHPVVHFEIGGGDNDKSVAFYKDLFDWEIEAMPAMGYNMVKAPNGTGIAGGIHNVVERGMQPFVTFYVEVEDISAALAKAEGLGGTTVMPRTEIPNGPVVGMFTDPDGLAIGLLEPMQGG